MPATIRLMRFGKKGQPSYRIVVIDKRKKRDGSYIEKIGFYNPMVEPKKLEIDEQKLNSWKLKGAVISEGMRKLLKHMKSLSPKKTK